MLQYNTSQPQWGDTSDGPGNDLNRPPLRYGRALVLNATCVASRVSNMSLINSIGFCSPLRYNAETGHELFIPEPYWFTIHKRLLMLLDTNGVCRGSRFAKYLKRGHTVYRPHDAIFAAKAEACSGSSDCEP